MLVLVFDKETQKYKLCDPMFKDLHTQMVEKEFIDEVLKKISRQSAYKYTSGYGYSGVYALAGLIIFVVLLLSCLILINSNKNFMVFVIPTSMVVVAGLGVYLVWLLKKANQKVLRYLALREQQIKQLLEKENSYFDRETC